MAGADPGPCCGPSRRPGPGARLEGRPLGARDFQADGAATVPSSATRGSGTVMGLEAGGSQRPGCLAPRVWTGRDHHDPKRVHLAHEHCSPRARSRRPLTPGATSAALHTPCAEVGVTDLRGRLPKKVPPASDKHGRRT